MHPTWPWILHNEQKLGGISNMNILIILMNKAENDPVFNNANTTFKKTEAWC